VARTLPTISGCLAVLATASEPEGSPLRPATLRAVQRALDLARDDLSRAVETGGVTATAEALGVSRSTLQLWRSAGWLA
jgi:hypothetical protein